MPGYFRQCRNISAFALALVLVACNKQGGVEQITETRTLTTPKDAPTANASSAQRLGMQAQPAMGGASAPAASFKGKTPEGWTEEPSNNMRLINLRPAGDPKSECYLTLLSGGGGGLSANVNRWRKQMGQADIDDAAIAALPKKPLAGGQATYIELDGTFGGMGGDQSQPDFKLVGLILEIDGDALFVKMTGPKAIVEQELPKFDAFCASIERVAGSDPHASMPMAGGEMPAGHPPVAGAMPGGGAPADSSGLSWTAPAGWTQGAPRQMRAVTYTMGADNKTECYVTILGNMGGGIESNINRWAGQMGVAPLTKEAIDALPKVTMLGKPGPMVELKGSYTDMSGNQFSDYTMLGAIGESAGSAIFVKLTGPSAEVEAQKANFAAFCESFK